MTSSESHALRPQHELAASMALVVQMAHCLSLELILLDARLDVLFVTERGAAVLGRMTRSALSELVAQACHDPLPLAMHVQHVDGDTLKGVELGAFVLPGATAIIVGGPAHQRAPSTAGLRSLYGLTPAEARVARALAGGYCPKQIAVHFDVELSTVRSHLRAIHAKLEATSQADLIRRLLGSIATFMPEPPSRPGQRRARRPPRGLTPPQSARSP